MWYYNDKPFEAMNENYIGFVYCITNLTNGKKYIGKKLFKFTSKRRSVKRVNKKHVKKESDWLEYYGSSRDLLEDVSLIGAENFKREILHLCKSKGELSYVEMKEQILRDVLLKPEEYYNAFVGGKIHRKHVIKI